MIAITTPAKNTYGTLFRYCGQITSMAVSTKASASARIKNPPILSTTSFRVLYRPSATNLHMVSANEMRSRAGHLDSSF